MQAWSFYQVIYSPYFPQVISSIQDESEKPTEVKPMQHFVRRNHCAQPSTQNLLPPRFMTKQQSEELYPNVPHSWLCDGWLLRLIDPSHSGNYRLFQVKFYSCYWLLKKPHCFKNSIWLYSLGSVETWPASYSRQYDKAFEY